MAKRSGLFDAMEESLRKHFFTSAEDAASYALSRQAEREQIQALRAPQLQPEKPEQAAPPGSMSPEPPGSMKTESQQLPLLPDESAESSADAPERAV
jgi:hypothetical protein